MGHGEEEEEEEEEEGGKEGEVEEVQHKALTSQRHEAAEIKLVNGQKFMRVEQKRQKKEVFKDEEKQKRRIKREKRRKK